MSKSLKRWLVSLAFVAALGGATGAIVLAGTDSMMSGFGDIVFVSAIGAAPGSIMGMFASLCYRSISRWQKGVWAVAFAIGALAGAAGFYGFLWYGLSNMGE